MEAMILIKTPVPPIHDFVADMEANPVQRTSVKFWNGLFQALTYSDHLGSVFGQDYAQLSWTAITELHNWKEHLLRFGVEFCEPENTLKELRNIRQQAFTYLQLMNHE
jgi:hypothetical protein